MSRGLRRNRWCGKEYFPRGAQILASDRLHYRAKRDRLKSKQVRAYVHEKLSIGWTPELIAGRLKQQDQLPTVSRIDLSIHLLSCSALNWLSSSSPSQTKTQAAVSEGRRADQEPNRHRPAAKGRGEATSVWTLGSRYDCGRRSEPWPECCGRA